jgi:hypothetical protein
LSRALTISTSYKQREIERPTLLKLNKQPTLEHPNIFGYAYDHAVKQGHDLATAILNVKNHYLHVHLIAHSAGAHLIDTAKTDLLAESNEPFIHLTFLDAFTPQDDELTYGGSADYAEHYVDRSGL